MKTYSPQDLAGRRALMFDLLEASRRITLPLYTDGMTVRNKAESGYDPVTNADTEAERALRELILSVFPDDHIAGEEFDDVIGTSEWLWTLDPIDGTRGFVAGVPVWSTLIALSFQQKPVIGLIDHPALDLSVWGEPQGSWKAQNGRRIPIKARKCAALSEAILGCTEPLSMLGTDELAAYNVVRKTVSFSRLGLDAYGYSMVAEGRMDVIIEAGLKPCDVRALIPIIEGAGGKITNWEGGSCVDGGRVVAVGDPERLFELQAHLRPAITS